MNKSIDINKIADHLMMTASQAKSLVETFDNLNRQIQEGNLTGGYINNKLETTDDYIREWEDHWHREASVEDFWFDEKNNYADDYEDPSVLENLEAFLDYWKNNYFEVPGETTIFIVM